MCVLVVVDLVDLVVDSGRLFEPFIAFYTLSTSLDSFWSQRTLWAPPLRAFGPSGILGF